MNSTILFGYNPNLCLTEDQLFFFYGMLAQILNTTVCKPSSKEILNMFNDTIQTCHKSKSKILKSKFRDKLDTAQFVETINILDRK